MMPVRRAMTPLLLASVLATTASCHFANHAVLASNVAPRESVAVIVADGRNPMTGLAFAEALTQELAIYTTLEVLPQARILATLPHYPERIGGPYKSAIAMIDADFTRTDVDALARVAELLHAKYLYVVWMPLVQAGSFNTKQLREYSLIAQMYAFPQGTEVLRLETPGPAQLGLRGGAEAPTREEERQFFTRVAGAIAADIAAKLSAIARPPGQAIAVAPSD